MSSNVKKEKPIRLLIFTESFYPYTSGIARRFREIIEHLAHTNNYVIHVMTGCSGSENAWKGDEFMQSKVTISKNLWAIEFKDNLECNLPFLIPQLGIIRDILVFKPDIIHFVEQTPVSTFCGALAKSLSIPIVWSSHTNLDFYLPLYIRPIAASTSVKIYQLLRRTFLNKADCNLTVSKDFSSILVENGIKPPIHIWRTGVDEKAFNPIFRSYKMRARMFNGIDQTNKILLVSVGRLSPEKNFDFLIYLLNHFPQTFLCIVGDGPYRDSLKPHFNAERTHFMGFLEGEELAAAYASADFFVYASVSETFGQVYLEAMSSGLPIVAAEGKQMKEFFENGKHGYIWEPENVESAINAMNLAIESRDSIASNSRKNALKHSWSAAGEQINLIYSEIVTNKKSKFTNESLVSTICKFIGNFTQWSVIMCLVIICMLPFMKVAKPKQKCSSIQNQTKNYSTRNNSTLLPHLFLALIIMLTCILVIKFG